MEYPHVAVFIADGNALPLHPRSSLKKDKRSFSGMVTAQPHQEFFKTLKLLVFACNIHAGSLKDFFF